MKHNCEIIQDLLPLYADELASPSTRELVEEHLKDCEACKSALDGMRGEKKPVTAAAPLNTVKRAMRKRRVDAVGLGVCLAFLILFVVFAHISKPVYLSSEALPVTVREEDGKLYAEFSGRATAYRITTVAEPDGDEENEIITIEAWYSLLDRWLDRSVNTVLITEDASSAGEVYYCNYADGGELVPLRDKGDTAAGGFMLERLVLGYYLIMAAGAALALGLLWLCFRGKRAGKWLSRLFFVPVSYIAGHMLIMGTDTVSFFAMRGFILILIAAAAVYAVICLSRPVLSRIISDRRI
ncbi:MAG: zf-HC2 domain-containing protein [Clostridia bacterium]|nr:zf-HC2 domain-containing protein [Clostridia bacterium]